MVAPEANSCGEDTNVGEVTLGAVTFELNVLAPATV